MVDVDRLKKDGKTKYVKLLGKGILTLVDHLFWNLPFCSVKQSQSVRKEADVTEEEWSTTAVTKLSVPPIGMIQKHNPQVVIF